MPPHKRKKPHDDRPAEADGATVPAPRRTTRQTAQVVPSLKDTEKSLRSAHSRADVPGEQHVEAPGPPPPLDTNHDAQKAETPAAAPRDTPAKSTRRRRGQHSTGGDDEAAPAAAEIAAVPNKQRGKGNVTANEAKPTKETIDPPAPAEAAAPLSPAVPSRQSRPKTRPTTSSALPQTRKPRKAAGSARSSVPIPSPGGPASTSAAALASSIATPSRRISAVAQSQIPQPNPQGDRNINRIIFGAVNFRAWYPSYYGKDVLGDTPSKTGAKDDHRGPAKVGGGKKEKEAILERLFVCPCCFKYSREEPHWLQHLQLCEKKAWVPGHQIYTHPKARVHAGHTKKHAKVKGETGPNTLDEEASTKNEGEWSVWEVDGEKEPVSSTASVPSLHSASNSFAAFLPEPLAFRQTIPGQQVRLLRCGRLQLLPLGLHTTLGSSRPACLTRSPRSFEDHTSTAPSLGAAPDCRLLFQGETIMGQ